MTTEPNKSAIRACLEALTRDHSFSKNTPTLEIPIADAKDIQLLVNRQLFSEERQRELVDKISNDQGYFELYRKLSIDSLKGNSKGQNR